ncbi:MAG: sec-independent translocation protein [Modestobacter sp.]|nr:sec-independent translocation protein [Modestobacter sp.]
MEALTPWHLILIIVGFMLLFGYKKLPEASRSLGRSLRILRAEMRDMTADDGPGPTASARRTSPPSPPTPSVAELEAQAREAEARAAELRARAQGHSSGNGAGS